MTVELRVSHTLLRENLDGAAFVAALQENFVEQSNKILNTFRIYQGVASRIITDRKLIAPETEPYVDWTSWGGLHVVIHLRPSEGFDAMHDYYEWLSHQTEHARLFGDPEIFGRLRKATPDHEDYPEIRRRAWTFKVGTAFCTLACFPDSASEICKVIEVGTQPKLEMICSGSALPVKSVA